MNKNTIFQFKAPVPSGTETARRPQRNFLLLEFSILSFIAFAIIGYVVLSVVRPALEGFVIAEQQAETPVFVNRHVNQLLTEDDFHYPLTSEQRERMEIFLTGHLDVKGVVRVFITDSAGTVIYAKPQESIGESFADNLDVKFALERLRSTARFESIPSQEQETLGLQEAFVQAIPITFGASQDASGVVYIISRVGLLRKQIEDTQQDMTVRIIGGLFFLYSLLFVIVWRASRTIRRQASELASYATTLEERVRERTRKLEESAQRQIKQANELARLKDEFVFVAAHELKAPITHLRWSLDEFFSKPEAERKKVEPITVRVMEAMKKASDSLTRLVSDL